MIDDHKPYSAAPWQTFSGNCGDVLGLVDANGNVICILGRSAALRAANVAVIRTAPELLELLKKAATRCACTIVERESGHLVDCWVPEADELIFRAESMGSGN